ncbi:uncharacterized protein DUF3231 [Scopulibacillus darangshiensis]|uniref:Uncharacterized protein DUF3231 n=1 Tax=Scopulibacillus darangshiensis TaxID=442528 RepID=A0A4R2NDS6_9BACL|nr:DUF3231 family protein [Scopulibacillus darangshiensis]TCP19310.1 uncharacterized protein DUF3231 [Scopulibacillus darangshiensis]
MSSTGSNYAPLTATELGTLWMEYQMDTLSMRVLEYFMEKAEGEESRTIFQSDYKNKVEHIEAITTIFQNENAVLPIGYTENDVNKGVPRLWDDSFDMMYTRVMAKVQIGFYALHSSMAYREDIRSLTKRFTADAQETYDQTTAFLLEKGVLARPPYVSMPKEVEFVDGKGYMSGFNLLSDKRALNTVEIANIYQSMESNILGVQLMAGFAQSAQEKETKQYFTKGMELSKKVVNTLGQLLMNSDIQPPSTWTGRATDSTLPPFSDKLMMYNTSLLSTFGLGTNTIGAAFSLRTDLPLKMAKLAQDIFNFSKEGGKLMVNHNWMEEPPQAEDRNQLMK